MRRRSRRVNSAVMWSGKNVRCWRAAENPAGSQIPRDHTAPVLCPLRVFDATGVFDATLVVFDPFFWSSIGYNGAAARINDFIIVMNRFFILLYALAIWPGSALSVSAAPIEFAVDVMAVISKAGCNAGTCHGNLNGKGGLKLSLRGQDPEADYRALVFASRGRRINTMMPQHSLLLEKATGSVPHRGGIRFERASGEYHVISQWIHQGAPGPSSDAPTVTRLVIDPAQRFLVSDQDGLSLNVTAEFSDGSVRDVTSTACYATSTLTASVDASGRVHREGFGETTVIVRYLQRQAAIAIAFIPRRPDFQWSDPKEFNFVDRHVFSKLRQMRIHPAATCEDTIFVRRAYLDLIGRIPTAEEARRFINDVRPAKRRLLIDWLLTRSEFADYWALKWADILRVEEKVLDRQGVDVFHQWLRDSIAEGRPLNAMVRDLVTGTGNTFENPPANFYRANRDPTTRGETIARLFLGTRLQCARCHNHPFDRWTQDDYYQWASFFSQLDYEIGDNKRRDRLDKNEFVGPQTVLVAKRDELKHPNSGRVLRPKLLGGPALAESRRVNRLDVMADWLASPSNELFVKSQVNFVWYHLLGKGLVDPIDDFRLTNPPSHPALLDELAHHFIDSGFDLRALIRVIMNSRTYQLSARPAADSDADISAPVVGFSRAIVQRLPAEVLLDMQSDVLGIPPAIGGYNPGLRAVQIPGVRRQRLRDSEPLPGDRFLKTFGKPERILACECERSNETTLKQALTLIGRDLNERLRHPQSRIQQLAASQSSDAKIVDELYWSALSRPPRPAERAAALAMFKSNRPRHESVEDLAWALLNAKEFLFRH